jgi:hypothetical protein
MWDPRQVRVLQPHHRPDAHLIAAHFVGCSRHLLPLFLSTAAPPLESRTTPATCALPTCKFLDLFRCEAKRVISRMMKKLRAAPFRSEVRHP